MIELKELAAGALTRGFGGDTFNTAAYMARLGARLGRFVDYVSAVGDDQFSAEMVAYWNANGVGSRLTAALPGRRPGLYFITVDATGERRFTYWRGEAAVRDCFEAEGAEAALAALGGFDLVYLSGISLAVLRPVSRARLLARLEEIAAAGVAVAFDCNHRPALWSSEKEARAVWERVFGFARTVLTTVEELAILGTAAHVEDGLAGFSAWPHVELVIKDGPAPCVIRAKRRGPARARDAGRAGGRHHGGRRQFLGRLSSRPAVSAFRSRTARTRRTRSPARSSSIRAPSSPPTRRPTSSPNGSRRCLDPLNASGATHDPRPQDQRNQLGRRGARAAVGRRRHSPL